MVKVCLECHESFTDGKRSCGHKRVFRISSEGCGGIIYEKGEIPGTRKERREIARWSSEGEDLKRKIYVNCVHCGSINEITNHGFEDHDGVASIQNCIVCKKCDRHLWITLEEWPYADTYDDGEDEDDDDYEDDDGDDEP